MAAAACADAIFVLFAISAIIANGFPVLLGAGIVLVVVAGGVKLLGAGLDIFSVFIEILSAFRWISTGGTVK